MDKNTLSRRRAGDALLIIDVINDLEFPGGQSVLPWARKLVPPLLRARRAAGRAGAPVIYVNDNFGRWRDDFMAIVNYCTRPAARGAEVSRRLRPRTSDYFILKPRHSAFYSSSLLPLLEDLGVRRLVLAGIATNLCVLFTAHDAHMRQFPLVILSDCCAAESDFDHNTALGQLQRFCGAEIRRSAEFAFKPAHARMPKRLGSQ